MKYFVALASIAITSYVGFVIYQYALEQSETTESKPEPAPVTVETTHPVMRPVEDRANLVGVLEAGSQIQIVAKTNGYITEMPFDVGDTVRAGEIVAKLDDSQQRKNVSTAKATLDIAQAQMNAKQTEVELLEKEVSRERELAKADATSAQQLEAVEGQLEVGRAEYELERARVSEALTKLEQSQLLLQETIILAPKKGVVAERFVDVGNLAKNDVPLLKLVEIDSVRTIVNIVEHDYSKISVGQSARVATDAYPDQSFEGRIVRKAPVIDPATSTAALQIEIPNAEHLLKPGMHMRASILFQRRENVMVIPAAALLESHRFPAVMVVSGDPPQAKLREVEVGVNDGQIVEILSGIAADERIVALGSRIIADGQTVNAQHSSWIEGFAASDDSSEQDQESELISAE